MTESEHGAVREVLSGIAGQLSIDPSTASIKRLGGLTNRVYQVAGVSQSYCVRLPGAGTEEYINRHNEAIAAEEAACAGVSPQLVYANADSGVMVTEFLANTETMSPAGFLAREGSPGRAGEAFRRLHESGARFPFRFELFTMIDDYLKILAGKTIDLPAGYHDVLQQSQESRRALAAHPLPLAACHCDPLCENFLDTGQRMWIVDWEYAGMNDPLWDLADLAVEGGFNADQEEQLLQAYFAGEPRADQRGRVVIYKAMCDLLWTLWGLIQVANENPAEDFFAYSTERFERCQALLAEHAYSTHVTAVQAGPG